MGGFAKFFWGAFVEEASTLKTCFQPGPRPVIGGAF